MLPVVARKRAPVTKAGGCVDEFASTKSQERPAPRFEFRITTALPVLIGVIVFIAVLPVV